MAANELVFADDEFFVNAGFGFLVADDFVVEGMPSRLAHTGDVGRP